MYSSKQEKIRKERQKKKATQDLVMFCPQTTQYKEEQHPARPQSQAEEEKIA